MYLRATGCRKGFNFELEYGSSYSSTRNARTCRVGYGGGHVISGAVVVVIVRLILVVDVRVLRVWNELVRRRQRRLVGEVEVTHLINRYNGIDTVNKKPRCR